MLICNINFTLALVRVIISKIIRLSCTWFRSPVLSLWCLLLRICYQTLLGDRIVLFSNLKLVISLVFNLEVRNQIWVIPYHFTLFNGLPVCSDCLCKLFLWRKIGMPILTIRLILSTFRLKFLFFYYILWILVLAVSHQPIVLLINDISCFLWLYCLLSLIDFHTLSNTLRNINITHILNLLRII